MNLVGMGDRIGVFSLKQHAWGVPVLVCVFVTQKTCTHNSKEECCLKKTMTDKHSKWQGKTWRQSKEQWRRTHSSQDVWKSTSSDAKWTGVTEEMDHLKEVIHEKQNT